MTSKQRLLWLAIGAGLAFVLVCATCGGFFVVAASLGGASDLAIGPAVAIVRVEGIIASGSPPIDPFGTPSGAYSGLVVDHLRQAEEDSNVKAVVLRVDSPGGSVVGSDEIYRQVLVMTKPVVVSMGELAASGGYYVSAPATEIWANPGTLTGSIGVISQFINIGELLEEYGVEVTTIKSGEFKDIGSLFRSMSDKEKASWQAIIDETYEEFVRIVAAGRELPVDEARELADGRIYTGRQALELGLLVLEAKEISNTGFAIKLVDMDGRPPSSEYKQRSAP